MLAEAPQPPQCPPPQHRHERHHDRHSEPRPAFAVAPSPPDGPAPLPSLRRVPADVQRAVLLRSERECRAAVGEEWMLGWLEPTRAFAATRRQQRTMQASRRGVSLAEGIARTELDSERQSERREVSVFETASLAVLLSGAAEARGRADAQASEQRGRRALIAKAEAAKAGDPADAELSARHRVYWAERRARKEVVERADGGWLRARGAELRRQQAAVDEEEEVMAASMRAELRAERAARALEAAEAVAAAERAARAAEAELQQRRRRQLAAERAAVDGDEARRRDRWCDLELHERLGLWRERLRSEEAAGRLRTASAAAAAAPWRVVVPAAEARLRSAAVSDERSGRAELVTAEAAGWLEARRQETDAADRMEWIMSLVDDAARRVAYEAEEQLHSLVLSYTRAEAEDRSLALAQQRACFRQIEADAAVDWKASRLAEAERQVSEEMELRTLHWTPELWEALECGEAAGRDAAYTDEEDAREQLLSDEGGSFLRAAGMELHRQRAGRIMAEMEERRLACVAEEAEAARDRRYEEELRERQLRAEQRRVAAEKDAAERQRAKAALEDKWSHEADEARAAASRRDECRAAQLEERISALRERERAVAAERESEEWELHFAAVQKAEVRRRDCVGSEELLGRAWLEGAAAVPVRRAASAGAARAADGSLPARLPRVPSAPATFSDRTALKVARAGPQPQRLTPTVRARPAPCSGVRLLLISAPLSRPLRGVGALLAVGGGAPRSGLRPPVVPGAVAAS
eukprot:TRINITY_DN6313_c0_g2_i1.p1 TRINITY_DN6313_c0_g2~~TRINITY_DN6313_c0_g2_i1.p1  ORF type:complete len:772 (+),score=321.73 TRINITY_DN6313_c0_g2_i1:49-2316(+)